MSADNGIYILRTNEGQHRVLHMQAFENLYWSDFQGGDQDGLVPTEVLMMYGECEAFNRDEALIVAHDIYEKFPIVEYGIQILDANKSWSEIVEEAILLAPREIEWYKDEIAKGNPHAEYYERKAQGLEEMLSNYN